MIELQELAAWIKQRNLADLEIARIIGRPAEKGHIGEFIASRIFDIALEESATALGFDGRFRTGPLEGRTVNIKLYGKQERVLGINPNGIPDAYLVLVGPKATAVTSRGGTRPLTIEAVHLFDGPPLIKAIVDRGCKLNEASSVPTPLWTAAEIYPLSSRLDFVLTAQQLEMLGLFRATRLL